MRNRIPLYDSSSTKLAIFFSGLLILALVLLTIVIYSVILGDAVRPIYTKLILGLVLFICIGLFSVSFYVTKRINAITATADRIITTRDLSQRIPIDNTWDDLSKLAGALNMMLEEIEQLVSGMRQVTDNIAHDLRTPLTRLRNHIESMQSNIPALDANSDAQHEEFSDLIEECDSLLVTFNALLRIANIESGSRHTGFQTLDLASVVEDIAELYEPVANAADITLRVERETAYVIGDKDLLFQAFANLIDNAIKHTPRQGKISVRIGPHGAQTQCVISDTGPGIMDEHKPMVFRRFYRISVSRSTPGSGLGLSLVQAIIKLHKGTIELTDALPNGLTVTVTL